MGVPLISKKPSAADCECLLDKISSRINYWLSKHLSFEGRLQLLTSILYSILISWSSIFIFPMKVIKLIERKFKRYHFLWNGSELSHAIAKSKVGWDHIYDPKMEGGLGLKSV